MTPGEYCQEIERYLCRKNDGHLVRIVGPSFELVTAWAERGIPAKVAFAGIDRYFERYYAKGPRRRPVRIDFCEADVLDVFDEWRRAVGILVPSGGSESEPGPPGDLMQAAPEEAPTQGRHGGRLSLPAHVTRVMIRLTSARVGTHLPADLASAVDHAMRELDSAQTTLKGLRGEARARFLECLGTIDEALLTVAERSLPADQAAVLRARAEEELQPFRGRMPEPAYQRAVRAALRRLVRERFGLPAIPFDA